MTVRVGGLPIWPASACAAVWLLCHGVLELLQRADRDACNFANATHDEGTG